MSLYSFKKYEEAFKDFSSGKDGLKDKSILINRDKFGINQISKKQRSNLVSLFLSQFNNLFSYFLIFSGVIVFLLGNFLEFWVIMFVILLNAIIGFIQEGRAYKVFEKLQEVIKSEAVVLRNGKKIKISDDEVVVGDVLVLTVGDKIPADARVFESNNLKVNEASLTGESTVVFKSNSVLKDIDLPISDQTNMVFRGTYVVSGLALAVVVDVGEKTEIGRLAFEIEDLDTDLPIKKTVKNLSKIIFACVLFFSFVTLIFGLGYGIEIKEIFLIVVALFVSAIPESLPVVLTVVLVAGFHRMSQKNVLVKRLNAVDALGQTNIIAIDKTGTITKNQMKVEKIFVNNDIYYVTGDGYEPKGKILSRGKNISNTDPAINLMAQISASTSIGNYSFNEKEREWEADYGDPTEIALLVFAKKLGLEKSNFINKNPIELEIPFDMNYRHHSTINKIKGEKILFVAGAPENIIDWSSYIYFNSAEEELNEKNVKQIQNAIQNFTKDGYRILALAYQKNPDTNLDPNNLSNLVFVGLVGINDTIRKTVEQSIKDLDEAGIKAIMITGDHKATAIGVAQKIGLFKKGDLALSGKEISSMNDVLLKDALNKVTVFARVSPEQKLRLINLYRDRGEIVAMTGDGVNDVLSLVKADLGVSMGFGATSVAKEASDIILLDNNFGSLAFGVLEGRNIYQNIRKSVEYLLSTNISELFVIMFCVVIGLQIPLTPIQILWLNLVTDSFLVIGFAFEPLDKKLGKLKNWKPSKYLLNRKSLFKIFVLSFTMTAITLFSFSYYLSKDIVYAQTMALTVLVIMQIYNIFNIKSDNKSVFKTPIFNNIYLLLGVVFSVIIFIFAIYNPFLQSILQLKPIAFGDWLYILGIGLILILVEEIRKLFFK